MEAAIAHGNFEFDQNQDTAVLDFTSLTELGRPFIDC